MYIPVKNFLIPEYMSKKMGRPPLPKGQSKDIQIGVRFKPADHEPISKAAKAAGKTPAEWIRNAALGLAMRKQEWVDASPWTFEDLSEKTVAFEIKSNSHSEIKGTGVFKVHIRADGKLQITIESRYKHSKEGVLTEFFVPQSAIKFIRKQPSDCGTDFSLCQRLSQM